MISRCRASVLYLLVIHRHHSVRGLETLQESDLVFVAFDGGFIRSGHVDDLYCADISLCVQDLYNLKEGQRERIVTKCEHNLHKLSLSPLFFFFKNSIYKYIVSYG